MTPRKPIIGLVGAIGAGKSTVAELLAARGGAVVNADALGHDALEQPAIREQVLARWGDVLKPDGRVDRRKVAAIVFDSPAERKTLESWVFPYIRRRCEEAISKAQLDPVAAFVVLDAAVMLEAGWSGICDKLIYVDAPQELRIQRLAGRSGWTAADLAAREKAQMPAEEKKKHATDIIRNAGTRLELEHTINRLLTEWNIIR
jgi:dephospho-CoA kinase